MRPRRATQGATRHCQPHVTPQGVSDPDLAAVVAAWPDLPAALKAAVLALVRTARGGGR
jgi:hypothetical protein